MASKNNATTETMELKAILLAEVNKGDKEKAAEQVEAVVRTSFRNARAEKEKAQDTLESAVSHLKATQKSASSSLCDILTAKRQVMEAEANYAAIAELFEARFPNVG